MKIRVEEERDYPQVDELITKAFLSAEHSDGKEQDLVLALRKSQAFVPELSLVAERGGEIVGHILFTEIDLDGRKELALAPLSVDPKVQRQGIGLSLIREGHGRAKELGYNYSVVLGSAAYYPKAGYFPASKLGIYPPFTVPDENYMVYRLREDAPKAKGIVVYSEAFHGDV